jgi:hypothetical protein
VRQQVQDENKKSAGVDKCVEGYVFRQATAKDNVCVTPQSRDQAQADNAAAKKRLAVP